MNSRCYPSDANTESCELPSQTSCTYDPWLLDWTHASSLVSGGQFVKAYLTLSALLSNYDEAPFRLAILRAKRAESSYALMNYREAIDDCQRCVDIARGSVYSAVAGDVERFSIGTVARVWTSALVMREQYLAATAVYKSVLSVLPFDIDGAAVLTELETAQLHQGLVALPAVEHFRNSASASDWKTAARCLPDAMPHVADTPLRTLRAMTELELGNVAGAREVLQSYLPSIQLILSNGTSGLVEDRQLQHHVEAHFLLATFLLAKVSAFCGPAYTNIAAVLVQRCLVINPCYMPAVTLGEYLVSLEDNTSCAETCIANGCLEEAADLLKAGIELDRSNSRMCAALHLKLAEVHLMQNRLLLVISDCTESIRCYPEVAKAYLTRSKAYAATRQLAEASSDRAMAIRLNPVYEKVLREEEEEERERRHAEFVRKERSQEKRAKSFPSHLPSATPSGGEAFAHSQRNTSHTLREDDTFTTSKTTERRTKGQTHAPRQRQPTLYEDLALSTTASQEEIRKQFKHLTLECHPDRVINQPKDTQLSAAEKFKRINNAHSILSDPTRRAAYDVTLLCIG